MGCVGFVPGQNDPISLAGLGGAESIVNFAREEFGKMTAERQAQAKQAWQQAAGGVSDQSVIGAGGGSDAVPAAAALPSVDELFKELGLTDFVGGLEDARPVLGQVDTARHDGQGPDGQLGRRR